MGSLVRVRRKERRLTLQRVADVAGCAKSYLWLIERERRANPPSDELLRRLEGALGFEPGRLIAAARWQETPGEVRREVSALQAKERAAARLAAVLGSGRLDEAYRSGELERLVGRLGGEPSGRVAEWQSGKVEEGRGESSKFKGQRSKGRGSRRGRMTDRTDRAGIEGVGIGGVVGRVVGGTEVPLINKVAAGYPTEFTDLGYPVSVADEYVRCPDLEDPDAFAARVVGDSMLPEYREGDIVVFSPAKTVASGMDCFARIEPDHESTFKRAYFEKGEGGEELIRLQPLNPVYPARVLGRELVAGLYAAVSVMRRIG